MQFLIRGIIHIKGNILEFREITGLHRGVQEIKLQIRISFLLAVVALNGDLQRTASLGNILGIGVNFHSAQHIAHSKLCAGDFFIGFKAQQLHEGFLLVRNSRLGSLLFLTAA